MRLKCHVVKPRPRLYKATVTLNKGECGNVEAMSPSNGVLRNLHQVGNDSESFASPTPSLALCVNAP